MKRIILFICLICFNINIFAKDKECKYESNMSIGEKREKAIRAYQLKACDLTDNPDIKTYCYILKYKNITGCQRFEDKQLVWNCIEDVKLLKGD